MALKIFRTLPRKPLACRALESQFFTQFIGNEKLHKQPLPFQTGNHGLLSVLLLYKGSIVAFRVCYRLVQAVTPEGSFKDTISSLFLQLPPLYIYIKKHYSGFSQGCQGLQSSRFLSTSCLMTSQATITTTPVKENVFHVLANGLHGMCFAGSIDFIFLFFDFFTFFHKEPVLNVPEQRVHGF